jgi:transcriptional regulator with XRE-family HTH domain
MEEKLRKLMKHEGINSTKLAEMLGIQASGISHIMSGRNKPSYDFIVKLLARFPQINPDWLLIDKGPMYRDEIKGKLSATNPATSSNSAASAASIPAGASAGFSGSLFSAGAIGSPGSNGSTDITHDLATTYPQSLDRDDNDIIAARDRRNPNGSNIGVGTGAPNAHSVGMLGQKPAFSPETQHPEGTSPYGVPRLIPTSSIERIVVFYRDKTFTEYQPG